MKKILCICAYVYGRDYQSYIPVYIYSIIKNHPQYHVRIYLDSYLRKDIHALLSMMDKKTYSIIENFKNPYLEKNMEKRALRWMIRDNTLDHYEYIYVGDIDIYLVKDSSFLNTHILHMKRTKNIYSNAIRLSLKDFIKRGAKKEERVYLARLTGLHFYKTKQYYNRINKAQRELLWKIEHINEISKYERVILEKYILVDDERVLWYLIVKSHMKIPTISYQEYGNSGGGCRPEHGLHFGIGREKKVYEEQAMRDIEKGKFHKILEWRRNFLYFKRDYNSDSLLRKIINADTYVREIFFQTCDFFGYYVDDSEKIVGKGDYDKWIGIINSKR